MEVGVAAPLGVQQRPGFLIHGRIMGLHAEVEVCFLTVSGHVAFAMLVGVERAGVNVDIRVELLVGHSVAAGFQQIGQRCSYYSFAQRGNHASGNKDVLWIHAKYFLKITMCKGTKFCETSVAGHKKIALEFFGETSE